MTKQNSFTKKVFSLLLSLTMVLTMMPEAAFAESDIAVQADTVENAVVEVTIGDETTQYADINEAFKVVKDANDATIKLLRDTEIDNQYHDGGGVELKGSGKTTLDLNGKTLKQAQASSYASCGTVSTRETATLIIKDSAGGGRIQQINENPAVITNGNSTLIIESGTIETMNSDDKASKVCYLNCAVNLDDHSTVIINGGTLKGKRGVVEEVSSSGSLTINGGDISGTDGNALIVYGDSPATLSGGTFSTESNEHSIWVTQDGRAAKDLLAEDYHYETSTGAESTYSDDGKGVKGNTIVKIPADKQVSYINADGVEAAQTNFMELSGGDHAIAITQSGWFAVRTDTTIKGLSISDEVNLILCDGATLTVSDTLTVAEGCKLNIYFQTKGTGKLTAETVSNTDQIIAPAGAMKRTKDTNSTTFEKCLTHEWGETTSGPVFTKTCTLCGTVDEENAVAKLTTSGSVETYYTTLSEAFSAAAESENSTVQLLMDVQSTDDIKVTSGTFTIDLNGKKWEGTNQDMTSVLWVDGGNVIVTSSNGTGTISNAVNSAIYVANNATVHVTSGVRLNRLYAMDAANLTLDVGVIITDSFSTKAENLALFLTGKALQKCDADGKKTDGQYVSIYQGYNVTDTGGVIVIEHKSCDGTPSKETPCEICGYDGTQTKPTEPVDPNVAMIGDKKYESLQTAIGEANGADITLLRVFGENVVVEDGAKAGIILGTGDTVEGEGTYPSYWTAAQDGNPPYIPLTMNAGEITLKDGVLAQFIAGANNNIAISLKGGTLTVADTVTKIIGGSVDITSENTAQMAAIEATGGVLDLQGNTHLDGGLIMRDGAKLKNKLTAGTFTNSGSNTHSVSVEDSNQYNTVFDLLAEGYAFADGTTGNVIAKDATTKKLTENVTVIKCTHKGANNKSLFKDDTCTGCGFVCEHENVDAETGQCSACGAQINVANVTTSDDTKSYATLAAAIEAAEDNGTVILLTNVEENITITDGMKVTIDLNKKTWKGSGTTWQAAVPLTVKGGSVTVKNGTMNQGGASSYANSAVKLESGSLIVGDGMTIRGANFDGTNYRSAIKVESGELSLSKDTNLIFGMSVPEGKQLKDYLPENTAFYQAGHVITGDGEYFDSESAQIINGYVQEKTGDFMLTVAEHTHFVGSNSKCACGFTCAHSSFSDGKCDTCGYECTHPSDKVGESSGTATCGICNAQMVVKVTSSDNTTTYYAKLHENTASAAENTLKQVFMNAESGSTVTLLADGLYASGWAEGKELTLNLNGKNVIENNGFVVESKDGTAGKLIVTGSGSSETPGSYSCTFRVWNGELLFDDNFSGTFGTIYVHGGTLTSVNESQSAIHIGTLHITNSGATVSFKSGTFDTITCSDSVTLGDLLVNKNPIQKSGKAFKYTTGDEAFVPYDTTIASDSPVTNVTIVDCPHNNITDGKDSIAGTYGICGTCGMTGIAAILTMPDGSIETYDINGSTNDIFTDLQKNGGTLKLYSDRTFNGYLGQQGGTTKMVIDLNGHEISLPSGATNQEVTLNGGSLTITDSSSDKKGKFAVTLRVYNTASLTVDGVAMGTIGLQSETASITLKEGTTFTAIDASAAKCRIVEFLQEGCYIIDDSNTAVDLTPTSISSENGFTIKQLPGTVTADKKAGEIRYGSNKIADELLPTVTMNDESKPQLTYEWYYNTDSGAKKLITITKSESGAIYNMERGAWNNLSVGDKLDVFCIISAETVENPWKTPVTGYTLTVTAGDLAEASIDLTGSNNPVYTPEGYGSCYQQTLQFSVSHNGTILIEGTDYQIKDDSNHGYNAGKYTLVLEGLGKYAGSTLEYEWNIAKRELTGIAKMTKTYDGTEALPEQITFAYNGGEVTLTRGGDYEATGGYYSAGAGASKDANAKITLKNTNYTFANDETTKEFFTSESISKAEITKAKAPSDIEDGTITVYNNRTADYSYDVPGELLPKLADGKRYDNERYTSTWNSTDSSYKVTTSDIGEHGQLSLRVEAPDVNKEKQIGSFTITVKSENYEDFTLTVNVNAINKLTPTGSPVLSTTEITYGDSVNTISLSGDMKYGEATVSGNFEWINGTATPDAGSYEAEWKFIPGEDIYKEVTGKTTITVKEATLTGVSVQQTGAFEYNGNAQTATVVTNATAVNGQTVTFTYSNSEDGTYSDTVPAFTDAGTYTVYYKAAAANHETVTGSFTVTIAARKLTIKEVKIKNKVYDGKDTAEIGTVTFDGLVGTDTVEYTASDVKFNSADVKDANKVTGTITLNEDVKNYVLTDGNFTAKANISKADATCTAEPTVETLTYNGKARPLVKAGTATGGTLVYSTEKNETYSAIIPTGTEAKTYTVWYKVIGDGNHSDTTPVPLDVTIQAKTVNATVTLDGDNFTYNGKAHTPKVTVKDGNTVIASSEYSVSYSNNTDAGKATVTVTDKDGGNYTVSGSTTFTIKPCDIKDAVITLDGSLTYTGKEQPQKISSVEVGNLDVTYDVTGNTKKDANDYTLTVTGTGNFTGTATQGFTIAKAKINVTGFETEPKTYDGKKDAEVKSVSFEGLVNSETLTFGSDFTATAEFNDASAGTKTATVTVTLKDTSLAQNYALGTATFSKSVEIAKAEAQDVTKEVTAEVIYGDNTEKTASVANVNMPEDAGAITYTKGSVSISNVSSWDVSNDGKVTYAISGANAGKTITLPVVISSTNYNDVTVNVVITVGKAQSTISITNAADLNREYDGKSLTAQYNKTGDGDVTVEYFDSEGTSLGENAPTDAGTYKVVVTQAAGANYEGSEAEAGFTIAKATVTTTDKPTQNSIYAGTDVSKATFKPNETSKKNEVTVNFNDNEVKLAGTWSITEAKDTEGKEITQFEKAGKYTCTATFTPEDPNFAPIIIDGIEITVTNKPSGGGAVIPASEVTTVKTGTADEKVTTSPAEVKTETKTGADGSTETISKVTVSDANQKEIIKQVKDNKSEEIIIKVSEKDVKDGTKLELDLDKDFVDSIVKDTDAKLTIKTPAGDKTFTQEELKKLSESAEGDVITIDPAASEPAEVTKAEKITKAKSLTEELNLVARSSKTAKKNVKVVLKKDKTCRDVIEELKELGFTVKYRFYRSTKKSAGYKSAVTKKTASYINTSGKKGTKYFYKVQVRVYDENGKLIAKTALKQCKYASRTWSR